MIVIAMDVAMKELIMLLKTRSRDALRTRYCTSERQSPQYRFNPELAECAQTLTVALARLPESVWDSQTYRRSSSEAAREVIAVKTILQAFLAFGKMRILHSALLRTMGHVPISAWRCVPISLLAEVMACYARCHVPDPDLLSMWASVQDSKTLARADPRNIVS
jgi:hypothetical protein